MVGLTINYNENYEKKTKEFKTIKSFVLSFEKGNVDIAPVTGSVVEAVLYELPSHIYTFPTLKDLYDYCVQLLV